jgi:LCP family protein required for cell wall assembly
VTAAVLSALVPGAGQWYAGRRRRALVIVALAGAATAGAFLLASRDPFWLLETFVQPRWLWAVFAGNVVVGVLRVAAALDAYRLVAGSLPRRPGPVAVAALLSGFIAVPHVVVGDYTLAAIDLTGVFVDEPPAPLAEREAELLAAGFTDDDLGPVIVTPPADPEPGGTFAPRPLPPDAFATGKELIPYDDRFPDRPELVPTEATAYDAPFEPFEDRFGADRVTVLLAGGDAGPGRWSLRTDVMIVATVDLTTDTAVLFGVSRNLSRAPLPAGFGDAFWDMQLQYAWREEKQDAEEEGRRPVPIDEETYQSCDCFPDRLNALWTYTNTWVRTFPEAPDPGMEMLRRTLSLVLGLDIDYYVLVDFAGFVDLVDAIGGVEVNLEIPMDVAFSPAREGEDPVAIDLEPGRHHLDGRQALAYVRNRDDSDDNTRMRRQRCMLRAVADAADVGTLVSAFPEIAEAISSSTTTDIPLSVVPDLIRIAAALDADRVATVGIGYPNHHDGLDYRGQPIIDVAKVRATVQEALAGAAAGGTGAIFTGDECG